MRHLVKLALAAVMLATVAVPQSGMARGSAASLPGGVVGRVTEAASLAGHPLSPVAAVTGRTVIDRLLSSAGQARVLQTKALALMTPASWATAQAGARATTSAARDDRAIAAGLSAMRVDTQLMWQAAAVMAQAVDALTAAIADGAPLGAAGIQPTPLGDIIIDRGPAPCDSTYSASALLIIDMCGGDTYKAPAGGANGLSVTPISVVIDTTGSDFATEALDVMPPVGLGALDETPSVGAGVFGGIAFFVDQLGSDAWGTGIGGLIGGVGKLGGFGMMVDLTGDDVYAAVGLNSPGKWGAGHFAGTGILLDVAGNDDYSGDTYEEGSGWFGDSFGLLDDLAGNDRYYDFSTFSIGSGGVGGIGILRDGAGNDRYLARIIQ